MKKYKLLGAILFSLAVLVSAGHTTVFADPGEGNTNGTIQLLTPPNPGQEIFFTLSPPVQGDGGGNQDQNRNRFKLRFTDVTAKDQRGTPQPVWAEPYKDSGKYQFVMPKSLIQGDAYDITVTINGDTYEGSFTAPVDPGHQLPETRYAIVLPIMLLAVLVLSRRRRRGAGQN